MLYNTMVIDSIFVKWLYQITVVSGTTVSNNVDFSVLYNSIMLSYNIDMGLTLFNLLSYVVNFIGRNRSNLCFFIYQQCQISMPVSVISRSFDINICFYSRGSFKKARTFTKCGALFLLIFKQASF